MGVMLAYIINYWNLAQYEAILIASTLSLISSKCMYIHFCKDEEPD